MPFWYLNCHFPTALRRYLSNNTLLYRKESLLAASGNFETNANFISSSLTTRELETQNKTIFFS